MFNTLKKILGIQATNHSRKRTEAFLFSGSAYFSSRVPRAFTEKWVAHGGEISSGTTLDVRARYFFATDPSEPWVTKLSAKSVMVIHAGWIVHCVDEAFQVPISKYILDDRFVPGPPYKLTNSAQPAYVPLSEPSGPIDTESGESGPTPFQTSDTPSTPTSRLRKRTREQAYFDSPSGSLVFSGFDKNGLPRRPKKQRKLRFDPSFSPEGGRSGKEPMQGTVLDWLQHHGEFSKEHGQHRAPGAQCDLSRMTTVRLPDTPDKPLAHREPVAAHRGLSADGHLAKPACVSSPVLSIDTQEKIPPVRTIDFTNLPPPTRRWRFREANATKSGDTSMIIWDVKPTDHKAKTSKKISFSDHARACVYPVSPQRSDDKDGTAAGPIRPCLGEGSEDTPELSARTRMSYDQVEGSGDSTEEVIKNLAPQTDSLKINDDPAWLLGGDQFENDTLTLTMEQVRGMRHRLLESTAKDGPGDGQLATLFDPGKTFRGIAFRHVW